MCEEGTGVDSQRPFGANKPPDNPEVREEMKAIANKRRSVSAIAGFGVLLERKGH